MKNALIPSLLLLTLLSAAPCATAQTLTAEAERDIAISRALINDKRNTVLALNMNLTPEEAQLFWPLYEEYRLAMENVGVRKLAVIVDYAEHYDKMTQEKAAELLDRSFIYEEQALKVQQLYTEKFRRILPNTKVTRLMQLESRMDAAIQLKISEGIPLME